MDELVEILLELLFEFSADMTMQSRHLKTGVKTAAFCVLGGVITLFIIALTIQKWFSGDDFTGAFFMTLISAVLLGGVVFGAIHGHKKKWKNN